MAKILSISVVMSSPGCRVSTLEAHRERAYSPADVGRWLLDAGFLIPAVFMTQPHFVWPAVVRRELLSLRRKRLRRETMRIFESR